MSTDGTTPLREGTVRQGPAGPVLLASREEATGAVAFPPTGRAGWTEVELGRTGELFTYTRVAMAAANFAPGYTVGYVRFTDPDGTPVLVFGQLRGSDTYRVGQPMTVDVQDLWEREDGTPVRGHVFVPAEGERA
ncbi:Zn-ribbon domain-containing OB-fold protein [Georgenia sp. H159]|uniref:Zn-ribbon domain-containing OB-fold protein n=1 Tax=Georgenia sp. H159 TaxID=3076115 RepID=UPI002D79A292|nr:OB-fold domain-containing protein [Georgenia sp. H159]